MAILKKLKLFFFLDITTKLILVEAYVFLGWARFLKFFRFSKVSQTLGEHMNETSFQIDHSDLKLIRTVSQAVNMMSRYTFWESMCLVKAIAAMKMLERRHIESTLYLGTGKDENGKLIAHAWLRSGPFYITGAEEIERFTVVSKFAKKISH
jgi:hypothetical protein